MSKKAKSILFLLFFCLFSFLSHAKIIDKIAVVINDEIITQSELDKALLPIYARYKNLYSGRELEEKLTEVREEALRRMIDSKLLLAEAKRKEIQVTREEVESEIEEAKKRFKNEEEFKAALEKEYILLSDLEKRFKEKIMVDRLVALEMKVRFSVSPREVLEYYQDNVSEFKKPQKVKAMSILIRKNEKHTSEEARKLAEEILRRLEEGGDFAELAMMYSEGPYSESGGDMGWVEKGNLMPEIDEAIFKLEKGGISGVVETKLGFHIFKVEDKSEAETEDFADVKKRIEEFLYNKKKEEKLREWVNELRQNAYIAFK